MQEGTYISSKAESVESMFSSLVSQDNSFFFSIARHLKCLFYIQKNCADFNNFHYIWKSIFFEAILQNICNFFTVIVCKLFLY